MSHLQLALKPSETDGAAPASGWRARPRIAEDTLAIALTRAFAQAEMPHGPSLKIVLPMDPQMGCAMINIAAVEDHYELLAELFDDFPHAPPPPRNIEASWMLAARRAKLYGDKNPHARLVREDSDRLWDLWSYAWKLARRATSSRSSKVARLKRRLRHSTSRALRNGDTPNARDDQVPLCREAEARMSEPCYAPAVTAIVAADVEPSAGDEDIKHELAYPQPVSSDEDDDSPCELAHESKDAESKWVVPESAKKIKKEKKDGKVTKGARKDKKKKKQRTKNESRQPRS